MWSRSDFFLGGGKNSKQVRIYPLPSSRAFVALDINIFLAYNTVHKLSFFSEVCCGNVTSGTQISGGGIMLPQSKGCPIFGASP